MSLLSTRIAMGAFVIGAAVSVTGCVNWVKLSPGAERIAVANRANVAYCTKVASVSVQGRDNYVGTMKRNPETVAKELANLARNQAATTSGNTIVPAGPVTNGSQDFDVYNCR